MSITTESGDRGKTFLLSGEEVWKDDPRVEAYGTLDELDAQLGEAVHLIDDAEVRDILRRLQRKLFRLMGQLASKEENYPQCLTEQDVREITDLIGYLERKTPLRGFVIPGGTPASAKLDVCRTVVRRAERRLVALSRVENVAPEALQYVNRLSDLFFMLARTLEAEAGAIRFVEDPET